MGFSAEQAKHGLEQCNGSIERAIDWLFNHADETEEQPVGNVCANSTSSGTNFFRCNAASVILDYLNTCMRFAHAEYELIGFVSHVGKNTSSGHYVCHVKKVRV